MKRIFLIITIITIMLIPSCGRSERAGSGDLPEHLELTAELTRDYPQTMSLYSVSFWEFDEEKCISILMENGYDSKEEVAQGPLYKADNWKKQLIFYTKDVINGGVHYINSNYSLSTNLWREESQIDYWKDSLTYISNLGNNMGYLPLNSNLYSYSKGAIRDNSLVEVEQETFSLLEDCGFPSLELKESVVRDYETLNRNMEVSNALYDAMAMQTMLEAEDADPYQPNEYRFSEKDEDVRMVFRETIDGIPLADKNWTDYITGNGVPETEVKVLWNERVGVSSIMAQALFGINKKLEEVEIIAPQTALDRFSEEYDKSIHIYDSRITGIELNYITLRDGESYTAVPAWIFTLEHDVRIDDTYSYAAYEITAVNAATGEVLHTVDRKE